MDPSAATPIATTKCPPAGAPLRRDRQRRPAPAIPAPPGRRSPRSIGRLAVTSTPPVNSAARQRLTICSAVRAGGEEAVAQLMALRVHGAVRFQELVERRRVGGAVRCGQLSAVLAIAQDRCDGGQQGAFLRRSSPDRCPTARRPPESASGNSQSCRRRSAHKRLAGACETDGASTVTAAIPSAAGSRRNVSARPALSVMALPTVTWAPGERLKIDRGARPPGRRPQSTTATRKAIGSERARHSCLVVSLQLGDLDPVFGESFDRQASRPRSPFHGYRSHEWHMPRSCGMGRGNLPGVGAVGELTRKSGLPRHGHANRAVIRKAQHRQPRTRRPALMEDRRHYNARRLGSGMFHRGGIARGISKVAALEVLLAERAGCELVADRHPEIARRASQGVVARRESSRPPGRLARPAVPRLRRKSRPC